MTVALFWVGSANPSTEVSNCLRFLDSVKVLDTTKFGNSRDRSLFFKLGEKKGRKQKWKPCSVNPDLWYLGGRSHGSKLPVISSMVASHAGEMAVLSSEEMVYNVVLKQAALVKKELKSRGGLDVKPDVVLPGTLSLLSEAYDRCGEVCAEYAKTFYLGTLLMTPERRRAIWAIYGIPRFGRLHGDIYVCRQSVIGDAIRPVGGMAVVLALVEAAETRDMLHMALTLLACALHQNPQNVKDMKKYKFRASV